MDRNRGLRLVLAAAVVLPVTLLSGAGMASAAETVSVSDQLVYAAPDFQADRLGRISGQVEVSCETTADGGFGGGGVVMLKVRGLNVAGGVGYITAPLGQQPNVGSCDD